VLPFGGGGHLKGRFLDVAARNPPVRSPPPIETYAKSLDVDSCRETILIRAGRCRTVPKTEEIESKPHLGLTTLESVSGFD